MSRLGGAVAVVALVAGAAPGLEAQSVTTADYQAAAGLIEMNLRGYGDLDENVPPVQAFRLIDALVRANKPYDLLYMPGRPHSASADPYAIRRVWDYFLEHLLGQTAPPDAKVTFRPAAP